MFEKIVNKSSLAKLTVILLIASIAILSLSILTDSRDGRKQIADLDGAEEERLCAILSGVKGIGEVDVIVRCDEEGNPAGVIVSASGGDNPIVANKLTNAVATLYHIPVSNVIVFEKEQEE